MRKLSLGVGNFVLSRISDLALSQLSPEESLRILEEIEKSGEMAAELELIIDIINIFQSQKAADTYRLSDFP